MAMTDTDLDPEALELAERISKVRREFLEGDRRRQEIRHGDRLAWSQVIIAGAAVFSAGGVFMAAAVALMKYLSGG